MNLAHRLFPALCLTFSLLLTPYCIAAESATRAAGLAATHTIRLASDGFPTGQDSPEGAACDFSRAFISCDASAFLRLCAPTFGKGEGNEEYARFREHVVESMRQESARKTPSPAGPKALGKCYAARRLSLNGPASLAYAAYDFQDVMFVDVGAYRHDGERSLVRYLVIQDNTLEWYVHPLPSSNPLLSMGLNDESPSDVDFTGVAEPPHGATETPLLTENDVVALGRKLEGKDGRQVHAILLDRCGQPTRDVGSGIQILQWDIAGGVLTYPGLGSSPTFTKDGASRRLVRATERVGASLLQDYEMYTTPAPNHYGAKLWIGNLYLSSATYEFIESDTGEDLAGWPDQSGNFFMKHPKGDIKVEYAKGIMADTQLEDVTHEARVAKLTFKANDGGKPASFWMVTDHQSMRLSFSGDEPIPFVMSKHW